MSPSVRFVAVMQLRCGEIFCGLTRRTCGRQSQNAHSPPSAWLSCSLRAWCNECTALQLKHPNTQTLTSPPSAWLSCSLRTWCNGSAAPQIKQSNNPNNRFSNCRYLTGFGKIASFRSGAAQAGSFRGRRMSAWHGATSRAAVALEIASGESLGTYHLDGAQRGHCQSVQFRLLRCVIQGHLGLFA